MPKQTSDNIQALLKVLILATIAGAAISSRLFSVIRYISSIFCLLIPVSNQLSMNSIRISSAIIKTDFADGSTSERQNIWSTRPFTPFGIGSTLDHGILSAESPEELSTQVSW